MESGHFAPYQGLAAMGWKMFVRPGFFYYSSGVSPGEEGLDLRYLDSAVHDRLTTRQQK